MTDKVLAPPSWGRGCLPAGRQGERRISKRDLGRGKKGGSLLTYFVCFCGKNPEKLI